MKKLNKELINIFYQKLNINQNGKYSKNSKINSKMAPFYSIGAFLNLGLEFVNDCVLM